LEITARHWLIALLIAGLLHAALAYALVRATVPVRAHSEGVTLELGLGAEPGLAGVGGDDDALEAVPSTDAPVATTAPSAISAVEQARPNQTEVDPTAALRPAATAETLVMAKALPEPRPAPPSAITAKQATTAPKTRARQTAPSPTARIKSPPKQGTPSPANKPRSAPKVAAPSATRRASVNRTKTDRSAAQGRQADALGNGDAGRSDGGAGAGGRGSGQGGGGNKAAAQNYYGRIATWLARHKRYPNQARRLHQQGTVKVTFTVSSNGRVISKRITKSSGHALLDREVQNMLERASPLPRIPSSLNRSSITITLPVAFNLR
jgi:protein TonB